MATLRLPNALSAGLYKIEQAANPLGILHLALVAAVVFTQASKERLTPNTAAG